MIGFLVGARRPAGQEHLIRSAVLCWCMQAGYLDALIVEAVGSIMPICSVPPGAAPTPTGMGSIKPTDSTDLVRGVARGI